MEALEDFKHVRAPFDGIVTARDTDIGAYVPSGSGIQLFRMARLSPLRVYLDAPEGFAPLVHVGDEADLTVNQFPARKFAAHVVTTSGAINPTSKRLLISNCKCPTKRANFQSGAFVQVTLQLRTSTAVTIPVKTLIFEADGSLAVAVVHSDRTVEVRKVQITQDLGRRVQVRPRIVGIRPAHCQPAGRSRYRRGRGGHRAGTARTDVGASIKGPAILQVATTND